MPNLFEPSSPFQAPFVPWFFSAAANQPQADVLSSTPLWGQALEAQWRLWAEFVDMQRKIWSFYTPLIENAPVFLNGATKTVAEDEAGLEPAETVDGIPDALELQLRTWNHFLDANRRLWSTMSWATPAAAATETAATEVVEPARPAAKRAAPRKPARSKR